MPSTGTLTTDDKNRIKAANPAGSFKIMTATLARIYYAYPDPNEWSYIGQEGALVLVFEKNKGMFYFRLVDLKGTRGVTWEHEVYDGLTYFQDRPFMHSFAGDDCMIGFVFSDEKEANLLKQKFEKRSKALQGKTSSSKKENASGSKKSKSSKSKGKIDKSLISAPKDFKHLGHMGYSEQNGFSSSGVDDSWNAILSDVGRYGISEKQVKGNEDFIKSFVETARKEGLEKANSKLGVPGAGEPPKPKKTQQPPPAPPVRAPPAPAPAPTSAQAQAKNKRKPPPPPVPRRGQTTHGQSDSVASVDITPPPSAEPTVSAPPPPPPPPPAPVAQLQPQAPPPPPPIRGSPVPPPAPPPVPPARTTAPPVAPPPPPPPPPQPIRNTGTPPPAPPPPPPPPPGPTGGAPPPPPPPPPPVSSGGGGPPLPAVADDRANLLASIQGKGIHNLRKTDPNAGPSAGNRTSEPIPPSPGPAAGGGDLASALAAALNERNKNLGGDSDEEEEDDEEWD